MYFDNWQDLKIGPTDYNSESQQLAVITCGVCMDVLFQGYLQIASVSIRVPPCPMRQLPTCGHVTLNE